MSPGVDGRGFVRRGGVMDPRRVVRWVGVFVFGLLLVSCTAPAPTRGVVRGGPFLDHDVHRSAATLP